MAGERAGSDPAGELDETGWTVFNGAQAPAWLSSAVSDITEAVRKQPGISDLLVGYDPAGFVPALAKAAGSMLAKPLPVARAGIRFSGGSGQAIWAAWLHAFGLDELGSDGPGLGESGLGESGVGESGVADERAASRAGDRQRRRHRDPAYAENAWFALCRQQHALFAGYLAELSAELDVDPYTRRKVEFLVDQLVAASAPANFLPTNPVALKRAVETGGLSLARGVGNLVRDVATNRGMPRKVTPGRLRVGAELASTPGSVVYRNRLIELIQYEPSTETVHEVPLLFSPPWINKYYIMDLAPSRSLVSWAVDNGHTCFMISYRNPDESMRELGMGDYLRYGPLAALEVIRDITGAESVNGVALCLGGTLIAAASAWLAARGEHQRIRTLTLTNTLLDFAEPGPLGAFTDPATVDNLARLMRERGYLPSSAMATTFDLLRPDDLVWSYAAHNWLLGGQPTDFDMLAWNADSTRMPETMHTEYLRSCYVHNELASGTLELAGERLDLGAIRHDSYLVTAEADHIAPWTSVYSGARLLGGQVRLVLSNSGHIAGVVNPPGAKSRHRVSEGTEWPLSPTRWRAELPEQQGSWWLDWTAWIGRRAGERRRPPATGSARYPPLLPAPGSYVHT